jgi:D-alanyl-D-alanine carboxypeptidase
MYNVDMDYRHKLQQIDELLNKIGPSGLPADTQVRIYSKKRGIDYCYASDSARPYHTASVGKVFVVALLLQLADQGKIGLDQPITQILSVDYLKGLFEVDGQDYATKVTARQLAMHTSGVNDYFDSKSSQKSSFIEQVITKPDHVWTPDELIDYTRNFQIAVGRPGEKFHYSDTGYVLLGKILEKVSGTSYGKLLEQKIFKPLGMSATYLYEYPVSHSTDTMAPLFVNGVDVSTMASLTCDWAGGGVVTTADDLLLFQQALTNGEFGDLAAEQSGFPNKFQRGIHYGFGLMELHFNEFFFLLRGMPTVKGHIGITATHMFYDETTDTHYIMNFGSDKRMVESFRAFIKILQILK